MEFTVIEDQNEINPAESTKIENFELNAEIVAGSLTSNAKELKNCIEAELKNYTVEKYIDNPAAAKKDKAFLNKIKDAVADKRKEVTKTWNKPLDEFLDEMKSLENSISDASSKLADISKAAENKEKQDKQNKIEEYWKTLDFSLVPLERIFNPKWLNKTTKMDAIQLEIESIIEKISTELNTVRQMQDVDSDALQSFYLETLDLNATLTKGNQLKANREAIRKQDEQWKAEKLQNAGIVESPANEVKQAVEVLQNAGMVEKPAPINDPVMSFTLYLTGPKSKLQALRQFIDSNGIKYKKVDYK